MIVTTVAMAGLLALAGSADPGPELFEALDANQDGWIDSGEVAESQRIWFGRALRVADADGDDRLTPQELAGALADPERRTAPARRFRGQRRELDPQQLDRNNDGMITLDEVPGPGKERFSEMLERTGRDAIPVDAVARMMGRGRQSQNKGGSASRRKVPEMKDRDDNGRGDKGRGKNGRQPPGSPGKAKGQVGRAGLFDRFDRNKDGEITRAEAPEAVRRNFDRIDANGDGTLTRAELKAARNRREQRSKRK